MTPVHGLHHNTTVAGDPQQNLDSYTKVMGLRLFKKTVSFDDPSSYHLFYGVDGGQSRSIISFLAAPKYTQGKNINSR